MANLLHRADEVTHVVILSNSLCWAAACRRLSRGKPSRQRWRW
jgi:hypothetical protein